MRVLFVSSFNNGGISPIVEAQGESLLQQNIKLDYFGIHGKGLTGYLSHVFILRRHLNLNKYDIVHAHYSLCGMVAYLARAKPLVVSLMGSDVNSSKFWRKVIALFARWSKATILMKSKEMNSMLGLANSHILPNGVNLQKFYPMDKNLVRSKLGWSIKKNIILFPADPNRPEKNFGLFKKSVDLLKDSNIEYQTLGNIPSAEIPKYLNASDVVCLTSKWEGSPNVIKEAMSCNIPIVSTNVGDVVWLLGSDEGHYAASSENASTIAVEMAKALDFSREFGRTKGRQRLRKLMLDSESKGLELVKIYQELRN